MSKFVSIVLAASAVAPAAHECAAQAPEPFSTTRLSERLYVVHGGSGHGSHVGVCVGDEGLLLIDSMLARSSERLAEALATISDKPVRFIVSTHHHSDHTGGNSRFQEQGAVTIAHPNSRFSPVQGDLKIENASLEFCGEEVSIHPAVAHTYDDLIIRFERSNVLFLGDTFVNNWHPTGHARGIASETETVLLALSLSDDETTMVPGHGFLDNVAGLERYLLLNENWYARLGILLQEGLSVEEMALDKELIELRDLFVARREPATMPPERFLRFIRQSLAAQFPKRVDVSASKLQDYEGAYDIADSEPIEIIAGFKDLIVRQKHGFAAELVPTGADTFQIRGSPESEIVFARGQCALPVSVSLRDEDFTLEGSRSIE